MTTKLGITELVLRDAHQSLFATRLRIEDMLPIAQKLDQVGYWSIETWGGATFDACIRYLGEDPWERLRQLKAAMPNTPQQMLFRAQNILGYRHYADDVVQTFIYRAAHMGMDVFRIFDAMNDMRNLQTSIKATLKVGKHAQGTMSYTVSPVHTIEMWLDMAKRLQDMQVSSICIKDMAGLLKPYVAEELVSRLKECIEVPIALHAHATTGLSTATITKAVEAGIDTVDTSISSMSMTYGHSATESVVAIFDGYARDTELDLTLLEDISAYFREVRKKYAKWEGGLKGIDSRILVSQVPGGMLTNMENQLKEQGAADKLDQVLDEIPMVRKDLGYIPLVTPTSQIVGTQAVLNVLTGERYKSISKETSGVLKGEYGATPAPVNAELQARVLAGKAPITCRPADLLAPEITQLTEQLRELAHTEGFNLVESEINDVLIYALFPQIGIKFLKNRGNPEAFEPAPGMASNPSTASDIVSASQPESSKQTSESTAAQSQSPENYQVNVNGKNFAVTVSPAGSIEQISQTVSSQSNQTRQQTPASNSVANNLPPAGQLVPINAPLAGNIFKVLVSAGDSLDAGQVVIILEAMKMETEIRTSAAGVVNEVLVKEGDAISLGAPLMLLNG